MSSMPSSSSSISREAASTGASWTELRARFPIFQRKVYLNSCSCGALATNVHAAIQQYLESRITQGSDWDHWTERYEMLRRSVGRLLNAEADEIALTPSASAALNAIASGLQFSGPRNRVVITDLEFPTHGQIWHAQNLRGAQIVQLHSTAGEVPLERFEQAIDDRTLLVATSGVCYRNGARLPVPQLAELAHRHGALLLVDDYQALGTLRETAKDQGADIVVGGMAKYLLGTAGIAFAYVRSDLVEELVPTVTGWFAQADIAAMDATAYHPSHTARRFEGGTPPVANVYAAVAGLDIIQQVGLPAIEERIRGLTDLIKSRALEAGYSLATPARHGAMIAIATRDERKLVSELAVDGIVTSCRDGNLRVSPHFYNDPSDIDSLFAALRKLESLLR